MEKVKVIAEIANAHQGDVNILNSLIKAAANSGADGVKFQWFKYDHLATEEYNFYKSYKDLFIEEEKWQDILSLTKQLGLEVWVDIFDQWGLELAQKFALFIHGVKIPSTIIQGEELIEGILMLERLTLLGVGGWYDHEIDAFVSGLDQKHIDRLVLIHGFQGYPTKTEDANLVRIGYLKERYNFRLGLLIMKMDQSH
ncbi:hypothetical protein N752_19995 [Desulforamulus aquiferis]|nr:N-acetylneuraminate synthase family protein [Desulforamulus aquiferis]RYD03464.1 hypothetical protein N752_19995 [Desulforamulus aquiferis]